MLAGMEVNHVIHHVQSATKVLVLNPRDFVRKDVQQAGLKNQAVMMHVHIGFLGLTVVLFVTVRIMALVTQCQVSALVVSVHMAILAKLVVPVIISRSSLFQYVCLF